MLRRSFLADMSGEIGAEKRQGEILATSSWTGFIPILFNKIPESVFSGWSSVYPLIIGLKGWTDIPCDRS